MTKKECIDLNTPVSIIRALSMLGYGWGYPKDKVAVGMFLHYLTDDNAQRVHDYIKENLHRD